MLAGITKKSRVILDYLTGIPSAQEYKHLIRQIREFYPTGAFDEWGIDNLIQWDINNCKRGYATALMQTPITLVLPIIPLATFLENKEMNIIEWATLGGMVFVKTLLYASTRMHLNNKNKAVRAFKRYELENQLSEE